MAAIDSELTVDKEFEGLCPKLTEEEHRLLAESIDRDGCRDAIVTWANHDDTIIDGYNRYRICRKMGLGFKTKALTFATRAEVINWIVKNQIGRRNLNETQRATLAAHMVTTAGPGKPEANSPNSANKPVSAAKAAEICNVGVTSVKDAKKVLEQGSPALKEAVKEGKVAVSAAAAVSELPKAEQTKAVKNGTVAKVAKEVKAAKNDYGKCPNCAGTKWTKGDDGVTCAKCNHPHGEPTGGADEDRVGIQRSKTIKTVEALMRAFDDLNLLLGKANHKEAITSCKWLLKLAREWK